MNGSICFKQGARIQMQRISRWQRQTARLADSLRRYGRLAMVKCFALSSALALLGATDKEPVLSTGTRVVEVCEEEFQSCFESCHIDFGLEVDRTKLRKCIEICASNRERCSKAPHAQRAK